MRFASTRIAVVAACFLAAGCGETSPPPVAKTPTGLMITSFAPVPISQKVLPQLLLAPEQINAAMAAADMVVTATNTEMSDDSSTLDPPECLAIDGAAQAPNYASSGFSDVHEVTLSEAENFTHYALQTVVLFPNAEQARAFYDASVPQWSGCTHYTHTQSGSEWDVAPISNDAGVLSAITTQSNAQEGGWACGRALTANNNVVVDVNTCSANPANSAVDVAKQIAARVDAPPTVRP